MKKNTQKHMLVAAVSAILLISNAAIAQNVAIVNGKAVPNARVEALAAEVAKSGRPVTPEVKAQIKDEVIAREIFIQEAEKRGLAATDDYKAQMELARQTILIRQLFADFQKTDPVTEAELKAEYETMLRTIEKNKMIPKNKTKTEPNLPVKKVDTTGIDVDSDKTGSPITYPLSASRQP